ncbi:hypothetical protein DPMN_125669 [Dreissena polymorpha]|uniref:Uncharacterized protein n=1 Tax=Dreissena polymorpha TaxID=45954 RepID=A0A9D4GUD2_DREPO|nr:hypothetical protein DPMN_125669 [Dreissena polymorpha]
MRAAQVYRERHFTHIRCANFCKSESQPNILSNTKIKRSISVDLFTAGHGDEPILIDRSPPIPGTVMDGDRLRRDRQFQADDHKICAQWIDFFDPESGIDRYV